MDQRQQFEKWWNSLPLSYRMTFQTNEHHWVGYQAALAAAPTPPVRESEPVAYQMWHPNFPTWVNCNKSVADQMATYNEGHIIRPLFTHPADDKLRKAAEEAAEVLEWYHEERISGELRAALKEE
jgi:hypothetical protein